MHATTTHQHRAHRDAFEELEDEFDTDVCEHGCEHVRLVRPTRDRVFGGVCIGIARWLGWEPWAVRAGVLALAFVTAAVPVAIAYGLLWMLMPPGR